MITKRLGSIALLWAGASLLVVAYNGSPATPAPPANLPPGRVVAAAPPQTAAADSAAPSASAGQPVPFVGRPTVGAAIRVAQANTTAR
jgi:hypothetical protein